MCVCVCEREREWERKIGKGLWAKRISDTEGGRACEFMCACVCEWECVRERERERESLKLFIWKPFAIYCPTDHAQRVLRSLSLSFTLTHTHFLDLFGVSYFAYDRQAIVCQPSITVWIQIGHNTEWDKSCCCCNLHRLLSGLSIINSILGFQCKWIYWKIFLTTMLMEKPKPN